MDVGYTRTMYLSKPHIHFLMSLVMLRLSDAVSVVSLLNLATGFADYDVLNPHNGTQSHITFNETPTAVEFHIGTDSIVIDEQSDADIPKTINTMYSWVVANTI